MAEKLRAIREGLGLSQSEMLKRLKAEDRMAYHRISEFESGEGEPSLLVLLEYAGAAGVSVGALIDDRLNPPAKLPARPKHKT